MNFKQGGCTVGLLGPFFLVKIYRAACSCGSLSFHCYIILPFCKYNSIFISLSVDSWVFFCHCKCCCCDHLGASLLRHSVRVSLLYTRGMENYRLSCPNLQDNDSSFPKWLYQSVLPLAVYIRALPDLYILLGLFSHFRFLLFEWYKMVCDLDLPFPHFWKGCWLYVYILLIFVPSCVKCLLYLIPICSMDCHVLIDLYEFVLVSLLLELRQIVLLNLLPICSLCFYFFKAILIYREVFIFPFGASNVCGFLKKLLLFPRSENHSPIFSLKSYKVLLLTLKFLFQLEFILMCGMR